MGESLTQMQSPFVSLTQGLLIIELGKVGPFRRLLESSPFVSVTHGMTDFRFCAEVFARMSLRSQEGEMAMLECLESSVEFYLIEGFFGSWSPFRTSGSVSSVVLIIGISPEKMVNAEAELKDYK